MKIEISSEKQNRFMKRKELAIAIAHPEEATPSTAAVQAILARQLNAPPERIEVMEIFSSLGAPSSRGLAFVWEEKNVKDLSKKELKSEAAPTAEAAAEQKAE